MTSNIIDSNLAFDAKFSPDMPYALGDPRKIRWDKYGLFGLQQTKENVLSGYGAYSSEWERGGPVQNDFVSAAAKNAGFGDSSNQLREAGANLVYHAFQVLIEQGWGTINYAEPGAGLSTVFVIKELQKNKFDFDRCFFILIEPSDERLKIATDYLKSVDLKEGQHFVSIHGRNVDIAENILPGTLDIVYSVATDHHSHYPYHERKIEANATRGGGIKINAEWCPPTCYHPSMLYEWLFINDEVHELTRDVWKSKGNDEKMFERLFPQYSDAYPDLGQLNMQAWKEIMQFWMIGYPQAKLAMVDAGKMALKGDPNDIFLFEAHSIPEDVVKSLKEAGYETSLEKSPLLAEIYENAGLIENPHRLLADSNRLAIISGEYVGKPQQ